MPKSEKLIEAGKFIQLLLHKLIIEIPPSTTESEKKLLLEGLRTNINTILEEYNCPQDINWLEGWPDFDFRGLSATEIILKKQQVETYVRVYMLSNGITNRITFVWAEDAATPGRFKLEAFLCPPARVVPGAPGPGSMDPQQPPTGGGGGGGA